VIDFLTSFDFAKLGDKHAMMGLACFIMLFLLASWLSKKSSMKNLHGSARFLKFREIKRLGLIENDGFIIGATAKGKHAYLLKNKGAHALILAPTRTGKGVCLVVPTLLTWRHSAIVYDIKRELYHLTAKYRGGTNCNNTVYYFDPASMDSHQFNPLNEIRMGTSHAVGDAQNIAYMLVDTLGKGILGDHWLQSAYTLLTGVILYLCHVKDSANIADVLEFLSASDGLDTALTQMLDVDIEGSDDDGIAFAIKNTAAQMVNKDKKELSGIVSTALTQLSLYFDPTVKHAVSSSTFNILDLCNAKKPATLYLVTDPNNKNRFEPLMRLLINMILSRLTAEMHFKDGKGTSPHKHPLLLLLDEFPSFGKIPMLESGLAFMAGYGINAMLIAQDLNQIYAQYGKNESIIANCQTITVFAPNTPDTAKWIESRLGETTIIEKVRSISRKMGSIKQTESIAMQKTKRSLMTAEELMTMPGLVFKDGQCVKTGRMLILVNGQKPILGVQAPFFLNEGFMGRVKV